jgi:predicted polyphosphate/ATP-dependent NAD kinase
VPRVGFLVNPIAGLGGRVGLKGTDGVAEEAVRRGATPVAPGKAEELLRALAARPQAASIEWRTCSGPMGEEALRAAGLIHEVVYRCTPPTSSEDTKRACEAFMGGQVDLVVFVGGDGTARDIATVVGESMPIVGVPAGVKMHSAVFGVHAASVAAILADFVDGNTATVEAEILDVDEAEYRQGHWVVRLYATAKTLHEPTLIQTGKMMFEELPDRDARDAIAEHVLEEMDEEPGTLFLLGPGGTLDHVKRKLGIRGSLLGVDAVKGKKLVAADLDESGLLRLLGAHPTAKLVLSPIGAQGFVVGRGNQEVSPAVIRRVGLGNLMVVATPDKLRHTPELRVDTGDPELDHEFAAKEYLFVVQGYREMKVHPIRA